MSNRPSAGERDAAVASLLAGAPPSEAGALRAQLEHDLSYLAAADPKDPALRDVIEAVNPLLTMVARTPTPWPGALTVTTSLQASATIVKSNMSAPEVVDLHLAQMRLLQSVLREEGEGEEAEGAQPSASAKSLAHNLEILREPSTRFHEFVEGAHTAGWVKKLLEWPKTRSRLHHLSESLEHASTQLHVKEGMHTVGKTLTYTKSLKAREDKLCELVAEAGKPTHEGEDQLLEKKLEEVSKSPHLLARFIEKVGAKDTHSLHLLKSLIIKPESDSPAVQQVTS